MDRQLIISIGREFGSGGHIIAEALAKRFDLPLYDHNLLEHIAEEKNVDHEYLRKYEEKPKLKFFTKKVKGHTNSFSEHIFRMQFEYLQKKGDAGESFVVVGRCSEAMLSHNPNLVSVFVLGDTPCKIKRVKEVYGLKTDEEAHKMRIKKDMERKLYHNSHCKGKWGDSRNYHISINSSKLGIEKTVDLLEDYIREYISKN
ncbi:MAG: cytidylate kinase-like family protein [Clostridia bacterium]|nr:cytidylate kinase-like family protein [Clostridia bacterium]